jgi:preprotein translocase subunit YajC
MFISEAFAQTSFGGAGSDLISFLPLIAIVVVFYFMLFRPQQQKAKKHKELLAGVRRGDRIVTSGGIIGTVSKVVSDGELQVEIAEGVRVRLLRATVTEILAKTEPAKADDDDDDAKSKTVRKGKTKPAEAAKPAEPPKDAEAETTDKAS